MRYPFNNSDFFDKSRDYILERGKKIEDVISTCEDADIATCLIEVKKELMIFKLSSNQRYPRDKLYED